jgi:hypothetical protein
MGGTGDDYGVDVSVDSSGNVYVTGDFEGTVNFAEEFLGYDVKTSAGEYDIFVTRINANGGYGWTKRMGGKSEDSGDGVSVDSSGNVYVTGVFDKFNDTEDTVDFAEDFGGSDVKICFGSGDIFVTRIAANGAYGWTKRMGGWSYDSGYGVSVDSSGNVYVIGYFNGTVDFAWDFLDFGESDYKDSAGEYDIFVTRINANGTYGWTKRMGGTVADIGHGVSVDSSGNVYLTGGFGGAVNFAEDFGGSDSKTSAGSSDIFVTRIAANGAYGWTKRMGEIGYDSGYGVSVDSSGNVYVTGVFDGTVDYAADFGGSDSKTSAGVDDIFVTRINTNGAYGWTKRMGGTKMDGGSGVSVDSSGNVYVTGYFNGTVNFAADFGGSDVKTSAGDEDIFITKIINPPDADKDGLPDSLENPSSCPNRTNPDSDGDGLCDGNLTVASVCVAGEDLDVDIVVDAGESDPCNPDSDGDGINDGSDCAKLDPAHWSDCGVCVDADGDNYGANCNLGTDCDDNAGTGGNCHNTCANFYQDSDADGYGNNSVSVSRCRPVPSGYVADNTDCSDSNTFAWNTCSTCNDDDADTWYELCDRYVGPPTTTTIGTGTDTWNYPLRTYYHDARTQVIYLASELGPARTITAAALDVTTIPGQVMENFTVRMKHTSLSSYATNSWEGPASGWTTVYQANETISVTGWRTFTLTTPFDYNGTSNLMVDFSFNNSSYSSDGASRYTDRGADRSIYYYTDSGYGDPLNWSGTSNPAPSVSTYIPNLRITVLASINGPDCDDGHATVYPGAPEICDGQDNQCPGDPGYGQVDEGCGPPDADGDGLPDAWENTYACMMANTVDNLVDVEPDGLTNEQEYAENTLPCDADTDNDGATDGHEINASHTSPLSADHDGDLMFDGFEIDHPCLNPLLDDGLADGDTDGLPNIHEYFNNGDGNASDPCNKTKPRRGAAGGGYFGDGDGNLLIGVPDLNRINLILNGRSADYSNAFPADPLIQDLDGNLIIGVPDKNLISLILNGKLTDYIAGTPTEMTLVEPAMPPTVAVGDTVRIQVELTNGKDNPSAGFGVVFTIVSGSGALLGGEGVSGSGRHDLTALDGVAQMVVRADGSGTILVEVKLPYDPEVHTRPLDLTPDPNVEINVNP